jgi:hypothetical protein
LRIGGHWLHKCSEIAHSMNLDVGQYVGTEGGKIHPFVGRVFGGPIVEVESIYIYVGTDSPTLKQKQSRLSAARALSPKIEGVLTKI